MTMWLKSGSQMGYEARSYASRGFKDYIYWNLIAVSPSVLAERRVFQAVSFESEEDIEVSPDLKATLLSLQFEHDLRMLGIETTCAARPPTQEKALNLSKSLSFMNMETPFSFGFLRRTPPPKQLQVQWSSEWTETLVLRRTYSQPPQRRNSYKSLTCQPWSLHHGSSSFFV